MWLWGQGQIVGRTAHDGKHVEGNQSTVATDAVTIQGLKFSPGAISVKVGATATWTNKDEEAHKLFFAYDGSRSPVLDTSAVHTKTFPTPGTYSYICSIHPFMTGTVVVA